MALDVIDVSDEWQLLNKKTGEVKDLMVMENKSKRERWEKVYARSLCDLLETAGDERTKVIAYMIRNKDYENRVSETVRSISEATGVSTKTVNRTLTAMREKNFLIKIRNGLWRFSPHVMVTGNKGYGAAVIRRWDTEAALDSP
jgi:hypothetical protein